MLEEFWCTSKNVGYSTPHWNFNSWHIIFTGKVWPTKLLKSAHWKCPGRPVHSAQEQRARIYLQCYWCKNKQKLTVVCLTAIFKKSAKLAATETSQDTPSCCLFLPLCQWASSCHTIDWLQSLKKQSDCANQLLTWVPVSHGSVYWQLLHSGMPPFWVAAVAFILCQRLQSMNSWTYLSILQIHPKTRLAKCHQVNSHNLKHGSCFHLPWKLKLVVFENFE